MKRTFIIKDGGQCVRQCAESGTAGVASGGFRPGARQAGEADGIRHTKDNESPGQHV